MHTTIALILFYPGNEYEFQTIVRHNAPGTLGLVYELIQSREDKHVLFKMACASPNPLDLVQLLLTIKIENPSPILLNSRHPSELVGALHLLAKKGIGNHSDKLIERLDAAEKPLDEAQTYIKEAIAKVRSQVVGVFAQPVEAQAPEPTAAENLQQAGQEKRLYC